MTALAHTTAAALLILLIGFAGAIPELFIGVMPV